MAGRKCNITDDFRRKSAVNMQQNRTSSFSFIPSSDKNFVRLLGLEEVVHFRLERLDKIVYALPGKRGAKGKKKLLSVPPTAPASSPQDPFTCSKCNTDVSCSWQLDAEGSIQCESCFKQYRTTECCPSTGTEAIHEYCVSTSTRCQRRDQQVPKNTLMTSVETAPSSVANINPDSPYYPSFYSDSSSIFGSCYSSEGFSPPSYRSSSSCASSPCDSSFSSYQPLSSDLSYTSSSSSSSPSYPLSKKASQKGTTPYRMTNPIAKALLTVDKVQENIKEQKRENPTKTSELPSQFAPSAAFSSPSLPSRCNQTILQNTVVPLVDSGLTSLSTTVKSCKQNLKKTARDEISQPKEDRLQPGQGKMRNSSSSEFCKYVSSTTSSFVSSPVRLKLDPKPKIQSATPESGKVTHQTSGANPRYSNGQTGPGIKNMKFDTKVQLQVSDVSHCSLSVPVLLPLSKSASSHQGNMQMVNPLPKKATVNWATTRNGKVDKWIQRKEISEASHGNHPSDSPSSSLDQPETLNQQVLKTKATGQEAL